MIEHEATPSSTRRHDRARSGLIGPRVGIAVPRTWPKVLAVLAFLSAAPDLVAGQQGLDSVDALASVGRTEEARGVLDTWWGSERSQSSRRDRQRGLWLRALLTVDPEMATLDYQRLVVGYPGGPYSDQALMRLAMIAGSIGDLLVATGYYRSLLQDYPLSSDRVRVRQLLLEHSEEIEAAEAQAAVEEQASVEAQVGAEAGVAEQDTFSKVDSEAEVVEAPSEVVAQDSLVQSDAPAEKVGRHAVQFGAFSTEERAERLAGTLAAAGFETRVVRVEGSRLVRVRVGRFAERSAASELMAEIDQLGYEAAVVSDVAEEEPIR